MKKGLFNHFDGVKNINKGHVLFICLLLIFYSLLVFLLPDACHEGDMGHWKRWSAFMLENGIGRIYEYGTVYPSKFPCNYPPVVLYFLKIYGHIQGTEENIFAFYKYYKTIPLVFDILTAACVFFVAKPRLEAFLLPFFLLFNIAFLYNSIIWGQVDSIPATFILLSLIFAVRSNLSLALIFYVIAVNTKLQAIIFLPVLALVLAPQVFKSLKHFGTAIGIVTLVQVIILSPFIMAGTLDLWYNVIVNAVDHYPRISLQAFNFWYLIEVERPVNTGDFNIWLAGMSFKTWGLMMFFGLSIVSLIPLLVKSIRIWKKQIEIDDSFREMVFLTAFLIAVGFFFFNTQMHERYSHPSLILAFFFGLFSRQYWLYGIISVAYLLNLESVLKAFDLPNYETFIFNQQFIASLFLISIFIGLVHLFRRYNLKEDVRSALKAIRI